MRGFVEMRNFFSWKEIHVAAQVHFINPKNGRYKETFLNLSGLEEYFYIFFFLGSILFVVSSDPRRLGLKLS
jgi:hypothetical protein